MAEAGGGIGLINVNVGIGGSSFDSSYFDRLAATVWTAVNASRDQIISVTNQGLQNNLEWNDRMTNSILGRIEDSWYDQSNKLDTVTGLLNSVLNGIINRNNSVVDASEERILRAIGNSRADLINVIGQSTSQIIGRIISGEHSIGTVLSGIDLKLDSVLGTLANIAQGVADQMLRKIEYKIENTIHLDSDIFDVILGRVNEAMRDQIGVTGKVIDVFGEVINGTFAAELGKFQLPLADQADSSKRMAVALEKIATAQQPRLGEDGKPIVPKSVLDNLSDWIDFSPDMVATTIRELKRAITGLVTDDTVKNPLEDDCLIPLFKRDSSSGIFEMISQTIIYAIVSGKLPFQMAEVQANRLIQNYRTCFPDHVFSPPELQALHFINGWSEETLKPFFTKQGYSGDDAKQLMRTWQSVPDITLLSNMLYREKITPAQWDSEMRKHGFTEDMRKNIRSLLDYLPPVQDLITMSVRDVFDAATVAKNRQYEDFPPDFLKWAKQQGVSEYWAKQYWAAHWRLPSENMGFEMFHRGIITEDRLKSLMKSLDIMPGWRDELLKLSYSPLTRVDVRRMHSVGVLSEAEVTRAYLDIGYSPENAKRLTDFTVRLNEGESNLTTDVSSDLSKSQIINLYKDGIINRTVANGMLLQADVNVVAAELLLEAADLDVEQEERKQLKQLILMRFKNGRYTFEEAVAEAQRLGFTDREREKILLELELEQAKQYKVPSVTDLGKMMKKGVLTEEDYIAAVMANGYSRAWAEKFLGSL